MPPSLKGLQQFNEGILALAADDIVRMLQPLLRHERGVGASQDDRNAGRPHLFGQSIGGRSRGGDRGDSDDVCTQHLLHIDGRNILDVDPDIVAEFSEDGAQQNDSEAGDRDAAVYVQVGGLRLHQHDLRMMGSPPMVSGRGPKRPRHAECACWERHALEKRKKQVGRYRMRRVMSMHLSAAMGVCQRNRARIPAVSCASHSGTIGDPRRAGCPAVSRSRTRPQVRRPRGKGVDKFAKAGIKVSH